MAPTRAGGMRAVLNVASPDPGVLELGPRDLVVATTGGSERGAFPLHRSSDGGRSWRYIGNAMEPAKWWAPRRGVKRDYQPMPGAPTQPHHAPGKPRFWTERDFWAPSLHKVSKAFLIYYSARMGWAQNGTMCLGVAAATRADGPYKDVLGRPLHCNTGRAGAIDPHLFVDPVTQELHLLWKDNANRYGKHPPLVIAGMSDDGLAIAPDTRRHLFRNEPHEREWEGAIVEAPWMYYDAAGGFYYLFYSANSFADGRYAVGVARARSINASAWDRMRKPLVSTNASAFGGRFAGPGHCAVVGSSDAARIFYHAWARVPDDAPAKMYRGALLKRAGRRMMRGTLAFRGSGDSRWPHMASWGEPSRTRLRRSGVRRLAAASRLL